MQLNKGFQGKMAEKDIHIRFRDYVSVNLLFAALDKSFPHFRNVNDSETVNGSGNHGHEDIFLKLKAFSTNFPHIVVDEKTPIL